MKIAIDCHNLEGNRTGVGRYLWNLLKEWEKTGQPAEFYFYFKKEAPQDIKELVNVGSLTSHIRVLGIKSNALYKHTLLPWAALCDKADILFCPDYVLPFFKFRRYKTAVTIHDIIYEARPDEYSWPSFADKILLKWASKYSAKKGDVIFCPSNFTKNEVLKYYKVSSANTVVTPLAPDPAFRKIDFNEPTLQETWQALKEKYGIGDKFIFFVGSIFNRRFLPEAIDAFKEFARERKNYQFLIIGENHTKPFKNIESIAKIADTELGRGAIILGKHVRGDSELALLYNKALATVWLSSYEGFGLPILESMACGTPVVTSRSGSLEEVGGDAAIYVENPRNKNEIAMTFSKIANDDNYRADLSKRCIEHARKFSWEETSRKTFDWLVKVFTE